MNQHYWMKGWPKTWALCKKKIFQPKSCIILLFKAFVFKDTDNWTFSLPHFKKCFLCTAGNIAAILTLLFLLLPLLRNHKMKVKVTQSCPTLCDPMDYTAHGILQARMLEWVDFPFSTSLPKPGTISRLFFYKGSSWFYQRKGKTSNLKMLI